MKRGSNKVGRSDRQGPQVKWCPGDESYGQGVFSVYGVKSR